MFVLITEIDIILSIMVPIYLIPGFIAASFNELSRECLSAISKDSSFLVRYELTHIFEISIICLLNTPKTFLKGLKYGALGVGANITIYTIFKHCLGAGKKFRKTETSAQTKPQVQTGVYRFVWARNGAFMVPIIEEVIFRVCIQRTLTWGMDKALKYHFQDRKVEIWKIKIDKDGIYIFNYQLTAKKIALLITTVLFILGHATHTTQGKIEITPVSFIFASLADSDGVGCSIVAHMLHNTSTGFINSFLVPF